MIPRRALDLIILSILEQNPQGLTGYALVNKFKDYFPISNISPGTLYPKLRKLNESGDISEKSKVYTITAQGKQRLAENSPKIIHDSLEFLPMLFKTLMKPLPFRAQLDFPEFCHISNHNRFYDVLSSDKLFSNSLSDSLEYLEEIKERLNQEKIRYKKRLEDIENKIKLVDKKIKKEEKKWIKVKIDDE